MDKETSLPQHYEAYRFRLKKDRISPEILISDVSGNILTTAGNITAITGPPKSGKTGVAGSIIAGSITESPDIDTLGLRISPNIKKSAVIYINTELSNADFDKFNENILKRAKLAEVPAFYYAYNFNAFDVGELKAATWSVIERANSTSGIRLIVIDGIADYVRSVNQEEDCNHVIRECNRLAMDLNAAILLVIHNNPGIDKKSRGHLGSHAERKCETMFDVSVNPEGYSILRTKFVRNAKSINKICFKFNQEAEYHTFFSFESSLSEAKKAQKDLRSEVEAKEFLKQYHHDTNSVPYPDFVNFIMGHFHIKDRSAKNLIKKWKELGWIVKTDEGYRILVKDL